jgi:hypothetical protein
MYTLLVFSSDTRLDIQFIYSDSESVVEYKRLYFDLLWNRGMPARSRINELEGKVSRKSLAGPATKSVIMDRIRACMHVWSASRDIYLFN